jgi:DNA replication protein DnaC
LETNFEPRRLFANELDYERASLIVTSNKPFSAWGEVFGDETTAVAMIDRLVHHAESLSLEGDS